MDKVRCPSCRTIYPIPEDADTDNTVYFCQTDQRFHTLHYAANGQPYLIIRNIKTLLTN